MLEILILLLIITIIIVIIMMIVLDITINKLLKISNKPVNENKRKRIHTSISKVNFSNLLNGRYDKFKNKDGLYEPISPKKGIELKERKEE